MSTSPRHDRLLELLADRATGALTEADRAELEALLAEPDRELDAVIGGLLTAFDDPAPRPMPAGFKDRLAAEGRRLVESGALAGPAHAPPDHAPPDRARPEPAAPPAYRFPSSAGWLAAAVLALVAAAGWWPRLAGPPTYREQLAQLTEEDPGTEIIEFEAMTDPAAAGLTGKIYWSQARQEGYFRVRNLATNDPSREQYQFWFFDKSRTHPVDGGVFNLADGQLDRATGEYIFPIHAKLTVREPVMFAVTVEEPGGVVVTKQERVVMIAKPPAPPEAAPPAPAGGPSGPG